MANKLSLISSINFVDFLAFGLLLPLIGNHLRDLGFSHLTVGLINSVYPGLQIISGPIIGSWSDVRGRKSVLILTLVLCTISYGLLGFTESFVAIFLLRFGAGLFKQTQSICKTLISDSVPLKDQADAFGKSGAYASIGFIFGPLLGGHIAELENGFTYVCLITSFLFVVNIGLSLQLTDDGKTSDEQQNVLLSAKIKKELFRAVQNLTEIKWSDHWTIFLLQFLYGLSFSMYISNMAIYLRECFSLTQRQVGYVLSFFVISSTASALLLNQIGGRFYKNDVDCVQRLRHFYCLMTVSFVCLYLSTDIRVFLLFMVCFSMCTAMLGVVNTELILKQSKEEHRGSFSGAVDSITSMAGFITPVISGLIGDVFGEHSTLLFVAIPSFLATIVSFRMVPKRITEDVHHAKTN